VWVDRSFPATSIATLAKVRIRLPGSGVAWIVQEPTNERVGIELAAVAEKERLLVPVASKSANSNTVLAETVVSMHHFGYPPKKTPQSPKMPRESWVVQPAPVDSNENTAAEFVPQAPPTTFGLLALAVKSKVRIAGVGAPPLAAAFQVTLNAENWLPIGAAES
jgi:hypothetical protein